LVGDRRCSTDSDPNAPFHGTLLAVVSSVSAGTKLGEALVALLVGSTAVACQSTCEEAQEKMETCEDEIARAMMGRTHAALPLGVSDECNELDQCVAPCILDADCATIAWFTVTGGVQTDPNPQRPPGADEFHSCIDKCVREATE
jgi:hypothetical protein